MDTMFLSRSESDNGILELKILTLVGLDSANADQKMLSTENKSHFSFLRKLRF